MKKVCFLFCALCVSVVLSQNDDEYAEQIYMFRFSGRSDAIRQYLQRQKEQARFHAIFIVSAPRSFVWGEAIIKELASQLRKAKFGGSISAIVRGRRYYADVEYVRSNKWNIPTLVDTDGALLKAINAWDPQLPFLTIWDSAGTLWWWSTLDNPPTGKKLRSLLDSIAKSAEPLLSRQYVSSVRKPFHAESVGYDAVPCPVAKPLLRVRLQDDSTTALGRLTAAEMSSNGQWLAAFDFYKYSVRLFEIPSGKMIRHLQADTSAGRGRSWYAPNWLYHSHKQYLWNALTQPQFVDSMLWTIQVSSYIRHFSSFPSDTMTGIDKCYYIVAYDPVSGDRIAAAEFIPMTRTYCTGEYCAEGTFHPGSGFIVGKGRFYLPFRRGYLSMGSDTSIAHNPYENPIADTFYTYAPLYGAFSTETGKFLDSTIGILDEAIGRKYGLGLAIHLADHLSCDPHSGLCAWVQWLVPEIQLSDGRRIPLKHYWNGGMLDTINMSRRTTVPSAREVTYILDSAGAKVSKVMLTPQGVFVVWRVKQRGFPLDATEHGHWVVQQYDIASHMLVAESQVPRDYDGQQLVSITYDRARQQVCGLYQSARETSVVYFSLHNVSHHDK